MKQTEKMKMIDETSVVTYKSENAATTNLTWLAFVVLPSGKLWDVRFSGATEAEAVQKAVTLWNSEKARCGITHSAPAPDDPWADVPSASGRGAHFVGTVWMKNKATNERKRVPLTEISMYEKNGFERSGPRGQLMTELDFIALTNVIILILVFIVFMREL